MSPDNISPEAKRVFKTLYIITLSVSTFITLCFGSLLFFTPSGFLGYDCGVSVDRGQLISENEPFISESEQPYALLLVNGTRAHYSGGICLALPLDEDEIGEVGEFQIKAVGENVQIIEGPKLTIGETWNYSADRTEINIWWNYRDYMIFRNEGFVTSELSPSGETTQFDNEILIITGDKGSEVNISTVTPWIFFPSLVLSIYYFILITGKIIRRKLKKLVSKIRS